MKVYLFTITYAKFELDRVVDNFEVIVCIFGGDMKIIKTRCQEVRRETKNIQGQHTSSVLPNKFQAKVI